MSVTPVASPIEMQEFKKPSLSQDEGKVTHRLVQNAEMQRTEHAKSARRLCVNSMQHDVQFSSKLLHASISGDLAKVEKLLKEIPSKDIHPQYFEAIGQALARATTCGHVTVCRALLTYRCFPKEAARIALTNGQHEILTLIFQNAAKSEQSTVRAFIIQIAESDSSEFGPYRDYSAYKNAAINGHIEVLKIVMDYLLDPALFSEKDHEKKRIENAIVDGAMLGEHPEVIQFAIQYNILRGDTVQHIEIALSAGAIQTAETLCDTVSLKKIEDYQSPIPHFFYKIFKLAVLTESPKVVQKLQSAVTFSSNEQLKIITLACQKGDLALINFFLDKIDNPKNAAFQAIYWMVSKWPKVHKMPNVLDTMDFLFIYLDPTWLKSHKREITDLAVQYALHPMLILFFERVLPFIELKTSRILPFAAGSGNLDAIKLYFQAAGIKKGDKLDKQVVYEAAYFDRHHVLHFLLKESGCTFDEDIQSRAVLEAAKNRSVNTTLYLLTALQTKDDFHKILQEVILLVVSTRHDEKKDPPRILRQIKLAFGQQVKVSKEFLEQAKVRAETYENALSASFLARWRALVS